MPFKLSPEDSLQITIANWMERFLYAPPEGPYWSAINPKPNKSLSQASLCKRMGMKAGIADLLLVWKGRAIALELKAGKNTRSPAQVSFSAAWLLAGGLCHEIRSLDEFLLFVEMLGIPTRASARATRGLA